MTQTVDAEMLTGRRVVVTAGASGIGRAIADAFVAHGARVYVCDVSREALETCLAEQPSLSGCLADVAKEGEVETLFAEVNKAFGGLDILVNNAGIAGPTAGIDEIDPAEWRHTIDVNLNGQFYCARLATPMLRESHGVMINISSVAGRLGYPYRAPYAATKWAIVGLTQSLAKELGPDGVRVNAILPGIVKGPRIERVIAARADAVGTSYEDMERQYLEKVSLRRMVSAQDVASMALFLCSPGGTNLSGQALSVCGNVETL